MSLRGAASIIGIGELKPERRKPGRTGMGLAQEAARKCIRDSGLRKDQIDGLITENQFANTVAFAEYLDIRPNWQHSINMMGSSGATAVSAAAAAVNAGLAEHVLVVVSSPDPNPGGGGAGGYGEQRQYQDAHGPGPGANYEYALIAERYQYEYGLSDEDRVSIAVQQRVNAQGNPDAAFHGIEITTEDVINSRMVADPLRLLECVMPCFGSAAVIVSRAEAAKSSPHPPVYILGVGQSSDRGVPGIAYAERMTTSPVAVSARNAFKMAGLGPNDMDMASVYDCYTITVIIEMEDAGFAPKGEGGAWIAETDVTYKGEFPINTHGGQLSFGQPGSAGGMSHVTEGVRQLMGRGEGRQAVKDIDYCFVNG